MAPDMLSSIVSPSRQEAQDLGVTPTQAAAESNLARTVAESNEEEARKQIQIRDGFSHWQQWLGRRIKRTFVPPHISKLFLTPSAIPFGSQRLSLVVLSNLVLHSIPEYHPLWTQRCDLQCGGLRPISQ